MISVLGSKSVARFSRGGNGGVAGRHTVRGGRLGQRVWGGVGNVMCMESCTDCAKDDAKSH